MSTTLPNGLVIPDNSQTDDVGGVLLTLFGGAGLMEIPRFDNAGARSAAYPTVTPAASPRLSWVDSPGRLERMLRLSDGSFVWAPLPGASEALLVNTPAATPSTPIGTGGVTQATLTVTIPALPYPRRATIAWGVGIITTDTGTVDTYLQIDGTIREVSTVAGQGTGSGTFPIDVPPGTTMAVFAAITKTSGSGASSATNDAAKTYVRVDVAAA